jgi:hypothetical protein
MYCCDGFGGATPPTPSVASAYLVQPQTGAPVGFGKGQVYINNSVLATGASSKTLKIKEGAIGAHAMYSATPGPTPKFVWLKTDVDWYNDGATLAPGGSWPPAFSAASTWSFCPTAVGPGTPGGVPVGCAAPASATPAPRNGRIVRSAGVNKFGGAMKLLGGSKSQTKIFAVSTMLPVFYNITMGFNPDSVIGAATPGLGQTTKWAAILSLPGGTMLPMSPSFSFRGAGPWGTGTAAIQITTNIMNPTVTVSISGSDTRNASGVGNLQLVSGQLFNGLSVVSTRALGNVISVALPEPEPALGIGAAVLALAAVGMTRARRKR